LRLYGPGRTSPGIGPLAGYDEDVAALPADSPHDDPLDAERILRELPEREREAFLRAYREAVDGAGLPEDYIREQRGASEGIPRG
jgi:hypothetical protein